MLMNYQDISIWKHRFLRRYFNGLEKQLMARDDKGVFLSIRIGRMKEIVAQTQQDVYKRELINLYLENYGGNISLQEVLKRIEERRVLHHRVRYEGEKFPWTEVADDFVNEKREIKKLGHIVHWYSCQIAHDVYVELLDAVKKEASDNELKKIIGRWQEPKTKTEVKKEKEKFPVGFEWNRAQKTSKLYKGLLSGHFIDANTDEKTFEAIFSGEPVVEQVRWIASLPHLIYLFMQLTKFELKVPASIDVFLENTKWERGEQLQFSTWLYPRLCSTFIDLKGMELSSAKLRNASLQARNKPPRAADLSEILKTIK